MAAKVAYSRDDWKGCGDWDDMEVPKDPKERSELRLIAQKREYHAKMRAARPEPKRPANEWPQAEMDLMCKMWREGATASKISRALGNRSRSAVMGKVDRMTKAGVLWRDDVHNRANQSEAQANRPKGRQTRMGWGKGHDRLFAKTDASERASRMWRRTEREDETAEATVLSFPTPEVLDLEFDTIETGWRDPFAGFQMAA